MKEDRPILVYAARMHEEGRRFLLTEMKKAGLDELTTSCGDIFQVLFQQEGLSLTAVAQKIRRTKSTTCVMLDRLAKQGYVDRLPSESDGRASIIMLTEKGRALKPIMADISIRMNERILGSLTEDEADQLEVLLAKAVRTYGPAADETGKEGGGCTCSRVLKG